MTRSPRLVPVAFLALVSVAGAFAASGCVDPRGDYDDYLGRTTTLRGGGDAGPGDVVIDVDPTADFSGTYLSACLPSLAGDPQFQFLSWVDLKVDVAGGKVSYTQNWLNEAATKFEKASFVGSPLVTTVPLVAGKFKISFANAVVPGTCQRLGPSDLQVTNFAIDHIVTGKDSLCGEISGNLTSPLTYDFSPPGDFCVLKPFKEGDTIPTNKNKDGTAFIGLPQEDFHCP